MQNFAVIAAAVVAVLSSAATASPIDQLNANQDLDFINLPTDVQESIISKLPIKQQVAFGASVKNFNGLTSTEYLTDQARARDSENVAKAAVDLDIGNMKVYDGLLEINPHDGNHDYAAQMAGRRGDKKRLDEWETKYHRMPENASIGAAESGDVATFKHLLERTRIVENSAVVKRAAELAGARGDVEFLRGILELRNNHASIGGEEFIRSAAQYGLRDVVEQTLDMAPRGLRSEYIEYLIDGAAEGGHQDLIEMYFPEIHRSPIDAASRAYKSAAKAGHVGVMRNLDEDHRMESFEVSGALVAAKNDHRNVFDYVKERHGLDESNAEDAYLEAIKNGRSSFLDELEPHAKSAKLVYRVPYAASENGDLEQFIRLSNRLERLVEGRAFVAKGSTVLYNVAANNHWDKVEEWAEHFDPTAFDVSCVLGEAAKAGRMDFVVKILQSGIAGVMPNDFFLDTEPPSHPTLAYAKSRMLSSAKFPHMRRTFVRKMDPAEKLVYRDALPGAVQLAVDNNFSDSEVQYLRGLSEELEQ